MAPQSTTRNGLSRRGLPRWMASADTSLPVPVSPSSRIVASLGDGLAEHVEHGLHRGRAADHATEALLAPRGRGPGPSRGLGTHGPAAYVKAARAPCGPLPTARDIDHSTESLTERGATFVRRGAFAIGGYALFPAATVAAPSRPGCGCVTT